MQMKGCDRRFGDIVTWVLFAGVALMKRMDKIMNQSDLRECDQIVSNSRYEWKG